MVRDNPDLVHARKFLLLMHLISLVDDMRDFEYVASSMKKVLAGLETNSRRGNGTYEKMRLSKAYVTSLQSCLCNLSDLIVSSILPLQFAAVERFLSEVNHKITKSSEAEKVVFEIFRLQDILDAYYVNEQRAIMCNKCFTCVP